MTEATVPVPVALLKRLRDDRQLRFVEPGGALYNVYGDAMEPLIALIPEPPKVGDVVTAENVQDLPAGTVLRDNTDDIWLVDPQGNLSYFTPSRIDPRVFALTDPAWDEYEPVIISLPRD